MSIPRSKKIKKIHEEKEEGWKIHLVQKQLHFLNPREIEVDAAKSWGPYGSLANFTVGGHPLLLQLPKMKVAFGFKSFEDEKYTISLDLDSDTRILNFFKQTDETIREIIGRNVEDWYPFLEASSPEFKRALVDGYYTPITKIRFDKKRNPLPPRLTLKIAAKDGIMPLVFDREGEKIAMESVTKNSEIETIVVLTGLFIGEKMISPQIFLKQTRLLKQGYHESDEVLSEFSFVQ